MEGFSGGRCHEAATVAIAICKSAINVHHSSRRVVHSVKDVGPRCLKHRLRRGVFRKQPAIPIVSGHPNVSSSANQFPLKFVCARNGAQAYPALRNSEGRTLTSDKRR